MLARNHEATGFAAGAIVAASAGMPVLGCLIVGAIGAWAADVPDLDHAGATATKSLRWIPYWRDHPRDEKTGDYKRRKDGSIVTEVRWFPSRQVHLGLCAISAALWERFATDLDRRDSNRKWGPAFRVHRGFTHSVWFSLAFGLLWWLVLAVLGIWVPWNVAAALFGGADVPLVIGASMALGCLAHIAGDGCTDFGISPFAPVLLIDGRRYPRLALLPEPLRFKVNKKVELWLIAPLCSGLVGYSVLAALFGPVAVLVTAWQLLSALWVGLA